MNRDYLNLFTAAFILLLLVVCCFVLKSALQ